MLSSILEALNPQQLTAVTFPPNTRLQIIAGPGTGKTKLITSRVAYLLLHHKLDASEVMVTTFTKKAATEMHERLQAMLPGDLLRLGIGTFHSLCVRLLKRHGTAIGLERFRIADDRDARELMRRVLPELTEMSEVKRLLLEVSSLKARCITAETYDGTNVELGRAYLGYQAKLVASGMMDFDDILLQAYRLLSTAPWVVGDVKHVLVDEFQDTNLIQLRLMKLFSPNVTVVGDPDQSIYGFRDAMGEGANFSAMRSSAEGFYDDVEVVRLLENYRSTRAVLEFSGALLLREVLKSQVPTSFPCVYTSLRDNHDEARWIVGQIEYLTRKMLRPSAIAILFRASYQSRAIEAQLVRSRIPYTVVKGRAFWERKEVVMMLDYIKAAASVATGPLDSLSMLRTVNFPLRGIGPKGVATLEAQLAAGTELGVGLSKPARAGVALYLKVIHAAAGVTEPVAMVDYLYEHSGMKRAYADEPERELNVQEVRRQVVEFTPEEPGDFFEQFFLSLGLNDHAKAETGPTVLLSTIHASKGLEWDAVFVPSLLDTILPARWADANADEERRVFYVALTRARRLVYLSSYQQESERGEPVKVSRFMNGPMMARCVPSQAAFADTASLKRFLLMMGCPVPSEAEMALFVADYQGYTALHQHALNGSLAPPVSLSFSPPVLSLAPPVLLSAAPRYAPSTSGVPARLPPLAMRTRGKRLGMRRARRP